MIISNKKTGLVLLNTIMLSSLYGMIYIIFFGLMSINNPQIIGLSRTAAITLIAFTLVLIYMNTIYGKVDLQNKKRKLNFASCILSVFFTDIIAYLVLQIMNVNPANNSTLIIFGVDFPYLLISIMAQTFWIFAITMIYDKISIMLYEPEPSLIITDTQENVNILYNKIRLYNSAINIIEAINYKTCNLDIYLCKYDKIFVSNIDRDTLKYIEMFCYKNKKTLIYEPSISEFIAANSLKVLIDDKPCLMIKDDKISILQSLIKRIMDISISLLLLIILSPIITIISLLIKVFDNGPIFFRQKRLGLDFKAFEIIKFRTMHHNIDKQRGITLSVVNNDDRITKIGKILRKTRLDEIPQLINILLGDMTLVGPRPEMIENIKKYTEELPEFNLRLRVKPGLTGLAQIDGKYNTSAKDKLLMDLLYIENFSIIEDIKILLKTLLVFFNPDSTQAFDDNVPTSLKIKREEVA